MTLPRGDEYQEAVQNPSFAFSDPALQNAKYETDTWGLPKPFSGGFTTTYHFSSKPLNAAWAVRCFTRNVPGLQERYRAIEGVTKRFPFLVNTECQNNGIRIKGNYFPIIKMDWVEGLPLNEYIEKHLNDTRVLVKIQNDFRGIIRNCNSLRFSHGDLQHGNILISRDDLFLIDYDGVFLPSIQHLSTNLGHLNYQHPFRDEGDYSEDIDRFSAIVIDFALSLLAKKPDLWHQFNTGENLLFQRSDFLSPSTSKLIQVLINYPEFSVQTKRFLSICQAKFSEIPSLEDFLSGNFKCTPISIPAQQIKPRRQYLVLDGRQKNSVLEHVGEKIEVIGQLGRPRFGKTRFGKGYCFINYGVYPNHTFTANLWAGGLASFAAAKLDPKTLTGKWVSILGVVTSYKGVPGIVIENPLQIRTFSGEKEALQELGQGFPSGFSNGKREPPKIEIDDFEIRTVKNGWGIYNKKTGEQKFSSNNYDAVVKRFNELKPSPEDILNRLYPDPITPEAKQETIITCPHCNRKNRATLPIVNKDKMICGVCKNRLFSSPNSGSNSPSSLSSVPRENLSSSDANKLNQIFSDPSSQILSQPTSNNQQQPPIENNQAPTTPTPAKSGCFVATVAFSDPYDLNVQLLRSFRNKVLLKNIFGRLFSSFYSCFGYRFGKIVNENPKLKKISKEILKRMIMYVEKMWVLKRK